MSATLTGALLGAVLAFAGLAFGFWGFLLVLVLMAVGAVVARIASGELDVRELLRVFTGRRSSS